MAGGAEREHRAALAVKIPGEHVDDVDEPARDRSVLLRAGADASVDRGPWCRGQLPGDPTDRVGIDPAHRRDRLWREVGRLVTHALESLGQPDESFPGTGEIVIEQDVDDREQEVGIGARPDEVVFVGLLGGAAAARIEDDELAAACPQRPEAAAHVGGGHQAAVRREWVRAEYEQVIGAIDIGDGDRRAGPEHECARHLLRELVDRARGENGARPERSEQHLRVEQVVEQVGVRVPEVHADGVAVLLKDRRQAAVNERERFVPAHRLKRSVLTAQQRRPHPVGIVVQLLEREALGADEAVAQHVLARRPGSM